MATEYHDLQGLGSVHIPNDLEYAAQANRKADTTLEARHVGRLAKQVDDGSFWRLVDTTPTWATFTPPPPVVGDIGKALTVATDGDSGVKLSWAAPAPAAHATSHKSGESDPIKLDELATPDDNTNLNATASYHGLLPKLSGSATDFLNGSGAWSVPSDLTTAGNKGGANGWYKSKVGNELGFYTFQAGSTKLSIAGPTADVYSLDVAEANIVHQNISGAGTNTHAQIDSHIGASSAVHGVSGSVVGTSGAQTLASKTLTTPTIGDFTNAGHDHSNAAGGGALSNYVLLNGKAGGQQIYGGTGASEALTLSSTVDATPGVIRLTDDTQVLSSKALAFWSAVYEIGVVKAKENDGWIFGVDSQVSAGQNNFIFTQSSNLASQHTPTATKSPDPRIWVFNSTAASSVYLAYNALNFSAGGTITGATLTTPTISDFTNATHDHSNAAGGGQIDHTDLTSIGTNTHAQIDTHIAATVAHGATGAVVGTTNIQTLTNKTLDMSGVLITTSGNADLNIQPNGTGDVIFSVGGAERVRISDTGTVLIDQDSDAIALRIDTEAANNYGMNITAKWGCMFNQDIADGICFDAERNNAVAETFPLARFRNRNASDTKATIAVSNAGSGPHLTTYNTNENLIIIPNGIGITKIGSGSPTYLTASNGDLLVSDELEVGGNIFASANLTFTDATGTTAISTGSVLGVARAIAFDIPVGAGGAANAALDWQFQIDSTLLFGLIAETDGAGSYQEPVAIIPNYSADYGVAWASPPAPTPASLQNGGHFVAHNTNDNTYRAYYYTNGGWRYAALT
jgi:hypothetical protein